MSQKLPRAIALCLLSSIQVIVLHAQPRSQGHPFETGSCGIPNGGRGTNLYAFDPCAFTYSVPEAQETRLLRENPQCWMASRTVVNCSKPVTGNYGQVRVERAASSGARPAGGNNTSPAPYVIPSTPPPLGVPPQQRAEAEQLWQRAVVLIDRNQPRQAMTLLLRGGSMGDARAQATLGIRFQDGDGVRADDRAAAYWFSAAAAQGHRAAEYALGGMYEEGEGGLPKNAAKAVELYIKSANQGFDKAQLVLGVDYELGDGVPRSRPQAITLLRASGMGNSLADVLANPRTPARFADVNALGNYLAQLANAQFAAAWARARASMPSGGGGGLLARIMYEQWQARGGGGDPRNNGPAPTH